MSEAALTHERITIKQAARIMGTSEQFIRVCLQRGLLPFGTATKFSSKWTYYISPKLFAEYVGIEWKGDGPARVETNNIENKTAQE